MLQGIMETKIHHFGSQIWAKILPARRFPEMFFLENEFMIELKIFKPEQNISRLQVVKDNLNIF